jgi:hypothetical protein
MLVLIMMIGMHTSYLDIINFCSILTIPQLIAFRDIYKESRTKEYIVACEVLKLRLGNN